MERTIPAMTHARVLVCGGRKFANYARLERTLRAYNQMTEILWIIHGDAPGADKLAGRFALQMMIRTKAFPADWKANGKAAGPMRNQQMILLGRPDVVVAFPGGAGTADMVKRARRAGIPVLTDDQILAEDAAIFEERLRRNGYPG